MYVQYVCMYRTATNSFLALIILNSPYSFLVFFEHYCFRGLLAFYYAFFDLITYHHNFLKECRLLGTNPNSNRVVRLFLFSG